MFTGHWEWVVVLLVALLLFGRRLPAVARSMGKSIVEFKKGLRDVEKDIQTAGDDDADSDSDKADEPSSPAG